MVNLVLDYYFVFFFFSSRRRHTRSDRDWSSDVCSSDLAQLCRIDQHIKGDSGFVAVPLGESAHQVNQISALHPERTQVCDGLTQLRALVLDGLLEAGKAADGLVRRGRNPAPQDVQLDFDAQEGLKNSIVEVARNPAALCLDGSFAQMAAKKA